MAALATAASGAAMAVGHILDDDLRRTALGDAGVHRGPDPQGGDERQWLLVGLAAGTDSENKHLILLLVFALACGCVLARPLGAGTQSLALGGAVLAVALWVPNVLWQAGPRLALQLELAAKIAEEEAAGNRIELLPVSVDRPSPSHRCGSGDSWWLLRRAEARPYRPLGLAYVVLLATALLTGAKPYYTMGLLLALLAPAAWWPKPGYKDRRCSRKSLGGRDRRFCCRCRTHHAAAGAGRGRACDADSRHKRRRDRDDRPAFTANVARIWNKLPESERSTAVVYASNYGEAGAIAPSVPRSASRARTRATTPSGSFGRPPDGARPVIVVGYHDPEALRGDFRGQFPIRADRQRRADLDNEEQGAAIWTCASTVDTWSTVWPRLRSLNP